MCFCISVSRRPPSCSFPLISPVWALCGALQCHRYDRSTLSAQEIPLFVCSPPKGVKLSSWQLTRPLDSAVLRLSLSLSYSPSLCLYMPPNLSPPPHPPSSPNKWKSIPDCPRTTVWCGPDPKMSPTLLLSLHVAQYLTSILIPCLISFDKLRVARSLSPALSLTHAATHKPHKHTDILLFCPLKRHPRLEVIKRQIPTRAPKPSAILEPGLLFCLHCKFLKTTMKLDLHPRSSEKTQGISRVVQS